MPLLSVEQVVRTFVTGDTQIPAVAGVSLTLDPGDFVALVDAETGKVGPYRDVLKRVDGTGRVFDPNPVATSGDTSLVDGNDADEVYLTAMKYMNRARKGGGPALIEAMTYRHSGHSRADPAKYRPEGELEKWLKRDPINLYRDRLVKLGVADATLKDIEADTMRKVDEATAAARASSPPSLDVIEKQVWAGGGAAWRN